MALNKEELLIERYKVIALWPRCRAQVGDILVPGIVNAKLCWVSKRPGDKSTGAIKDPHPPSNIIRGPEFFPHLFRKLEWWEERAEGELPQYLKSISVALSMKIGEVCKVRKYAADIKKAGVFLEGKSFSRLIETLVPSDEEEYNAYIKKQTTNG